MSSEALCPTTSIQLLAKRWNKEMRLPSQAGDRSGEQIARARAVREHLRLMTGTDPVQYVRKSVHLVHPKLAGAPLGSLAVRIPTSKTVDGTYNVRISVQGRTPSGCAFVRVGFESIHVS